MAIYDAGLFMNIVETGDCHGPAKAVMFAKHEEAGSVWIRWRRRNRYVLQDDRCGGGEEGLGLLAPAYKHGATSRFYSPETLAQRPGKIRTEQDAQAAG